MLVTTVTPSPKVLPLGGVLARLVTPQLSVALTVKVTLLRLQSPESADRIRLAGQVTTGPTLSVTVTANVQLLMLPLASVAVFVTVVMPTGNVLPLGGVLTRFVTLQLSAALTLNVTLLRLHRPASALSTRLAGQVITGF
jgi:hypothetical protein